MTHIIDRAGDRKTRCGLTGKAAYPLVLARHVQMHVNGWDMSICPECAKAGWPT